MNDEFIIKNIGELVTNCGAFEQGKTAGLAGKDAENLLHIKKNAWIACQRGKIVGLGSSDVEAQYSTWQGVDARGGLVMPGFVDSHTHPVFAGSRASEFVQRLQGKSYQDIAREGGGIRYTVEQTRKASDDELLELTLRRLNLMLGFGITTIEAKTGYGLSIAEEIRHLKILKKAKETFAGSLYITCLPLHASSPEIPDNRMYIDEVVKKLIPLAAKEKLADAFDVFIEAGYFSAEECDNYARAVIDAGLDLRIHADEFSAAGAAEFAGKWRAKSADHLQFASEKGLKEMAKHDCTATILPGTSLFTKIGFTDAKKISALGCEIAVASDLNPGSCQIMNLSQIAGMAAVHSGLDPALCLLGVTYTAAKSLGYQATKGSLCVGSDADITAYTSLLSWQDWLYDFGQTQPSEVYARGKKIDLSSHNQKDNM